MAVEFIKPCGVYSRGDRAGFTPEQEKRMVDVLQVAQYIEKPAEPKAPVAGDGGGDAPKTTATAAQARKTSRQGKTPEAPKAPVAGDGEDGKGASTTAET